MINPSETEQRQMAGAGIEIEIINAFVDAGSGGNPAGVVFDADDLSDADMQRIAASVGLSETAFVSRSEIADFKLDFFTPTRRIAHCGHATIATFSHLAQTGRVGQGETSKETVDGPRKIIIEGDAAFMEQTAPAYTEEADWPQGIRAADVLDSLNLGPGDLLPGMQPVIVNTGNSFMIVPLRSRDTLAMLQPDRDAVARISEAFDLVGYYAFSTEAGNRERHATARMFAPAYGIPEEAATGMAAGPLACFLHDRLGIGGDTILIEQGHFMSDPSPSLLTARLDIGDDGRIGGLMVGGRAHVAGRKHVN